MEGYSVTEAASVLGVPTERVWELLARGVLAGTPEGETGMRVFLQPRPAPAAPEPSRPNGNGADEPQRELSPFRELLTEFRSLTERYGQALLALGEARGEVAALRSRVDLLEARMDLRLPHGGASGQQEGRTQQMPWAAPRSEPREPPHVVGGPTTRADEPAAVEEPEPHVDAEPRTIRRDSPRRATESFAEALARAQDPSPPELPGGPEAAAALSALRGASTDDAGSPEAALPRELPPADEVLVADEVPGEDAARDDATPGATPAAGDAAEEAEAAGLEAETELAGPKPADDVAVVEETAPGTDTAPEVTDAEAPSLPAEPSDARPAWQDERYTAEIGEPDWWEAEVLPQPPVVRHEEPTAEAAPPDDEPEADMGEGETTEPEAAEPEAAEPEAAEPEATQPEATQPEATQPEAVRPITDAGRRIVEPSRPSGRLTRLRPAPPSSDEETVLWFGRSPDGSERGESGEASDLGDAAEMEIAPATRSADEAPADEAPADEAPADEAPADEAPADEPARPDDAFAALEALSRAAPPRATPPDAPHPTTETQPDASGITNERVRPEPPTSAGRAYRRLRRIFPG